MPKHRLSGDYGDSKSAEITSMLGKTTKKLAFVIAPCIVGGCGLRVPPIKEIWDGPRGTEQIEFEIKKIIFCDLKDAVIEAEKIPFWVQDEKTGKKTRKQIIPDEWGAQVSLSLQVDESTALNPGVSITQPLKNATTVFSNGTVTSPQSFSLGLGGVLSSTATRIDKFDPYYSIAFLKTPMTKDSVCHPENDPFLKNHETPSSSSPLIQSDLGIEKWLTEAMFTNSALPSHDSAGSPNNVKPDTVGIEIKFVIVSSGNVTPTWKLVKFTGSNGNLPLFSVGRTRTHDLIITIGPSNQKTANTHLASQIGQAVSSGNQSLLH
ncbi:hypothetical protein LGH82_19190 [Mesorhizobium sp. PAMC28654]|uniref:hypothetical protein n=1 Tax=Mesorhizobium sp. PAMC28654 TaxID=2880934 RepID=UPI001D0A171D|nr:hypothetical protein [Mesorhizobium sp. PAMC28654]UDL87315.1 hypothetical protein LGH82_19190 [Mesorhizobium sp. PAMC28654]